MGVQGLRPEDMRRLAWGAAAGPVPQGWETGLMRLEWVRGPGLGDRLVRSLKGGTLQSGWAEGGGSRGRDSSSGIRAEGCSAGPVGCARPGLWGCKDPGDRHPRAGGQASGSWGRVRSPWDRPWAGRQAGSELRGCSEPSWGCRASSGVQRGGPPYRVPALRKHHVSRGGRGLRPGSGGSGGAGRPRFVPDRQLRGPASRLLRRPPPARAARAIV